MIELRNFRVGDEPCLRFVFESAIHEAAIRDCSQAEVDAWAPRTFDPVLCRTAQPFYIHFGFEIVDHHIREVRGVPIEYAAMRKILGP